MPLALDEHGARRRARVRAILGKPGGLRRWMLGSAVWILICAALFVRSGYLGKIAIFIVAGVVMIATFRARALAIGDEDEVRAALRRLSAADRENRPGPVGYPIDSHELDELVAQRENSFWDAPLPPYLEDDTHEE